MSDNRPYSSYSPTLPLSGYGRLQCECLVPLEVGQESLQHESHLSSLNQKEDGANSVPESLRRRHSSLVHILSVPLTWSIHLAITGRTSQQKGEEETEERF